MRTGSQILVTGRHVFWWITAFFAVVIGVNATMAILALSTFNGVSEDEAYVDGLAFNETLKAVDEQQAMGWSVSTNLDRPGGLVANIRAEYLDSSSIALTHLNVRAEFVRPVHQGYDFSVFLQQTGPGVYTAATSVPLAGQWTVRLIAEYNASQINQFARPYVLTYRTVIR